MSLLKKLSMMRNMPSAATEAYKLKLSSKKLSSGKCQVRFELRTTLSLSDRNAPGHRAYGYYLAEPSDTLKEVVRRINENLAGMKDKEGYFHHHLYHMQQKTLPSSNFILFPG